MRQVLLLYSVCFFHFLLRKKSPEAAAFRSLIQPHSYRIGAADQKKPLIGFRYLRLTLGIVWKKTESPVSFSDQSRFAVFDGHIHAARGRCAYLKGITGNEINFVLAKNALFFPLNLGERIGYSLAVFTLGFFVIPVCLFHKNRGSIALNLMELLENAFSLRHAKSHRIQEVYYFNGYEKDANFAALLLKRNGIFCNKIPSANPIKNFYRTTIADRFCFTASFQKSEYEKLKANWYVEETTFWPLYGFERLLPLIDKKQKAPGRSLGFISSGVWLRKKRGDLSLGVGEMESELILIEALCRYLDKHPEVSFSIYLHPIEKKTPGLREETIRHYTGIFGNRIRFMPMDLPSNHAFDQVDVSIAAHSSTNLERLFMGMKTLYAPLNYARNLFENDPINNIAAFDKNNVESLIEHALNQSEKNFFSENKLEHYHHSYFFPNRANRS